MPGRVTEKYNDVSGQSSTFGYNIISLTAANYDAQMVLIDALRDATEDVTSGELDGLKVLSRNSDSGAAKSSEAVARRELKWLVTYEDTTTLKKYQLEIPCPDVALVALYDGTEQKNAVLTHANWVAWITAFEAVARSPTGGAVNVLAAREVGRNL